MNQFILKFAVIVFICAVINPLRTETLVVFISEILAFSALAVAGLAVWSRRLELPRSSLFLILIACIPLLQYVLGQIFYLQTAVFSTLYLLVFWWAVILGFAAAADNESQTLQTRKSIFTAIWIAGVISSWLAIAQWSHLNILPDGWVLKLKGNRPYANLGQPNHLATFLLCASVAAWYLWRDGWIKTQWVVVGNLPLVLAIVLSQSRTAWLGSIFFALMLLLYRRSSQIKIKTIAAWLVLYVLCIVAIPALDSVLSPGQQAGVAISTVTERLGSGYERLKLWNQAIHAIMLHPLSGWGWYQTTAAQYAVIHDYPGIEWTISTHNLVLELWVWCGLVLGSAILIYLFYIGWQLLRNITQPFQLAAVIMVGLLMLHSLLEYPLYYSYFLILFGVMIGMAWPRQGSAIQCPLSLQRMIIIIIPLILAGVGAQYQQWERASILQRKEWATRPYYIFDKLAQHQWWLSFPLDGDLTQPQQQAARRVLGSYLTPYNLKKYIVITARQGQYQTAQYHADILKIIYRQSVVINKSQKSKQ